jgi:hypothetical protein
VMATDPPASIKQLVDWLRVLPQSKKGMLTRTIVGEWAGVDLRLINRIIKGEKKMSRPAQHRLSKLMRELNDGTIKLTILPDGGAMIARTAAPAGQQAPQRATLDLRGPTPRVDWRLT